MYNPSLLQSGFQGLIGLLQGNSPQVPVIGSPLTDSLSGIYVQDKHPIVTLDNIWMSAPDFNPNGCPKWVSGSNYALGVVVNYNGSLYQTLFALTGDTAPPPSDIMNWAPYVPFIPYLQRKMNQGVTNMISEVVKVFKLQDTAKAIIERQQLFRGGGSRNSAIVGDGSFVGFEILVQQAEALMVILDLIGLQFTQAQSLNIYCYHSSKESSAVYIIPVVTAGGGDFGWASFVAKLMYLVQNTAGTWIVGYFQNDLVAGNQAISRTWDCSAPPCGGCSDADLLMYNRWSRYTAFRNIKIPAEGLNGRSLPNTQYATYGSITNWGLNFSLTVRCDLTDFILYSKLLYSDAYAMQMTLEFIKLIASSTRINADMAQIKNQARAELNLEQKSTFINQYWDSMKALKADMSGFSDSCQPCDQRNNKKTAKWRSI